MTDSDAFIYGKNTMKKVVGLEIQDDKAHVYHYEDGKIRDQYLPNEYWILYAENYTGTFTRLEGDMHYKYADKFDSKEEYQAAKTEAKVRRFDAFYAYNDKEMFMLKNGLTYYREMQPTDVAVLSFDIETTGLNHNSDSKVLLITNTFRKGDIFLRRTFRYDEYDTQKDMVSAWCDFVRDKDPDILLGYNILIFDLPYLRHIGKNLKMGRDGSNAHFAKYPSKFRKDGSQSYDYKNVSVYGREVIDGFHLAIKYDIKRAYPSYRLKEIVAHEDLEVKGRVHYDASKIRDNYKNQFEWEKIVAYAEHDADDALKLYDLMISNYFYYSQHIPKSFQDVIRGATGSQVNSFMIRAYLQEGHSLPSKSDPEEYEGGISFGNPGIYKNVNKVDVASLYPSIILKDKVYDKAKDPKAYFLKMVRHFTSQRLANKRRAAETKERYFSDLEQSQKIFINSAYGFLGAPGLLFNSPKCAAHVTKAGREILSEGIEWAKSKGFTIVNADTDSFSYTTHAVRSKLQFVDDINELNYGYRGTIIWEDDGQYKTVVIVKAKNYVLYDGKSIKIRGSSLKATMKEPALREFIKETIECLIKGRKDLIYDIYISYATWIHAIDHNDIAKWCSKKTITKAVLNPTRTNEQRIKDAITKPVEEGDKIFVFFEASDRLAMVDDFKGTFCSNTLYKKLYKTLEIFDTIIDVDVFPNFALRRNEDRIEAD